MKNDKLINAIGKIDDDLIESAEDLTVNELPKRRGRRWLYAAVAAALLAAAVFITATALNKSGNGGEKPLAPEPGGNAKAGSVVLTPGAIIGGDETDDPSGEGGSADTSYAADTDGQSRTGDDVIGKLVIDGVTYIQIGAGNEAEKYTKAEFLGKASSFEGSYADGDLGVDGDVYTVSEDEELLVITLTNGGAVLLENAANK